MINELKRPDVRVFIQTHEKDDPAALVLQSAKYPDLPVKLIASQIQSRQKAKAKLPSFYTNHEIVFPRGVSMEQCSSEATALYKAELIQGKSLTDLTGGFGVDTYFFSRKIERINYVEQNEELSQIAQSNFDALQSNNISVYNTTSEDFLSSELKPSDCYYIDPARRGESNQRVFQINDCQPNVQDIIPELIKRKARALIKFSPILDIHQTLNILPHVKEVHVVSVKNDCKELVFVIDPAYEEETKIIASNITNSGTESISFYYNQEKSLPNFSMPLGFIYEPNAAIMKAGGFNSVAHQFGLNKLHRNSHLYTSDTVIEKFPGRSFKLNTIVVLNKKKLKEFLPDWKANITVRNYPDSVKAIRNKTKIQEGGDLYLFATTLLDNSSKILICKKT